MRCRVVTVTALIVAALVVPAGAGGAGAGCVGGPPPEVAGGRDEWPLPNRDYANTRAQSATNIGTTTVDELEVVWDYPVPGDPVFGNLTTNPVVVDGTVYLGALDGSIHAVDLDDGTARWSVPRDVSVFGPSGVAVGYGKVFGIDDTAVVAAHDAGTGALLWTRDLGRAAGNQVDEQPTVWGGCVFIATQGLLPGSRGTLFALDQSTGSIVWERETVPDDFWGNPRVNHGGGSWYPPTVDEARGRLYWGTSNPWPAPGAPGFPAGASRPGDNLYTDSALALDVSSGALDWHHQVFPHDIWDRDMVLTQLVPLPDGGDVVVHTGKGGRVLGYDPDTGSVRWDTEVGLHQNDDVTSFTGPLTVLPGVLGGVETPPAAADGVVYLAVMNAPSLYAGPDVRFNLNAQLGVNPSDLVAIDATTGEIRYAAPIPGDALGGVTVVGDLLFTSTFEGLLLAFDRANGQEVWRYQADGFVNGSPAVVGDTILFPVSGTSPSELLAFRLPPRPPDPTTSTTRDPITTSPPTSSAATSGGLVPSGDAPAADRSAAPAEPVAWRPDFTG